ncbi:hypothetical protein VTI28DRAFT_9568 [Corynascus sepedonium]
MTKHTSVSSSHLPDTNAQVTIQPGLLLSSHTLPTFWELRHRRGRRRGGGRDCGAETFGDILGWLCLTTRARSATSLFHLTHRVQYGVTSDGRPNVVYLAAVHPFCRIPRAALQVTIEERVPKSGLGARVELHGGVV